MKLIRTILFSLMLLGSALSYAMAAEAAYEKFNKDISVEEAAAETESNVFLVMSAGRLMTQAVRGEADVNQDELTHLLACDRSSEILTEFATEMAKPVYTRLGDADRVKYILARYGLFASLCMYLKVVGDNYKIVYGVEAIASGKTDPISRFVQYCIDEFGLGIDVAAQCERLTNFLNAPDPDGARTAFGAGDGDNGPRFHLENVSMIQKSNVTVRHVGGYIFVIVGGIAFLAINGYLMAFPEGLIGLAGGLLNPFVLAVTGLASSCCGGIAVGAADLWNRCFGRKQISESREIRPRDGYYADASEAYEGAAE